MSYMFIGLLAVLGMMLCGLIGGYGFLIYTYSNSNSTNSTESNMTTINETSINTTNTSLILETENNTNQTEELKIEEPDPYVIITT